MNVWLQFYIKIILEILLIITIIDASLLYQFIQTPKVIQLVSISIEQTISTTIVQGCIPTIKPTTVALKFDPVAQTCTAYSKLQGFNSVNSIVSNTVYYLRMPGKCGACATSLQAKQAILSYTYQNNACPDSFFIYDPTTGYCVANVSDQVITNNNTTPYFTNYASYTQGVYRNKTMYVMSRGLAAQALTHTCPFSNSTTAMFNSIWYCYTQFIFTAPSPTYITENVCGSWISGGEPIRFIHPAEPGYLSVRNGADSYVGIMLPSGGSGAASSYRYYDGSTIPAQYSIWSSNRPIGQQLVYIDVYFNLIDYNITRMKRIMCRSLAS